MIWFCNAWGKGNEGKLNPERKACLLSSADPYLLVRGSFVLTVLCFRPSYRLPGLGNKTADADRKLGVHLLRETAVLRSVGLTGWFDVVVAVLGFRL